MTGGHTICECVKHNYDQLYWVSGTIGVWLKVKSVSYTHLLSLVDSGPIARESNQLRAPGFGR